MSTPVYVLVYHDYEDGAVETYVCTTREKVIEAFDRDYVNDSYSYQITEYERDIENMELRYVGTGSWGSYEVFVEEAFMD